MNAALHAMRRRWNAASYDLLCAEIARLDAENEDLRQRLTWAEDCAESWRQDAIQALNDQADAVGGVVGLAQSGQLLVCMPGAAA